MGKLELVLETENLSIYSPKIDGETQTEFEKFMSSYDNLPQPQLRKDFASIIAVIKKMADRRKRGVGTLRLYCIRISDKILVVGNGGIKKVAKYEDDPNLSDIVNRLRCIERRISMETRKAHACYEDCETVKKIIETITI